MKPQLHTPSKRAPLWTGDHAEVYQILVFAFRLPTHLSTVADLKKQLKHAISKPILEQGFAPSPIISYFYQDYKIDAMRTDFYVSSACLDSADEIRDILYETLSPIIKRINELRPSLFLNFKVDPFLFTVYNQARTIIARIGGIEAKIFIADANTQIAFSVTNTFQEKIYEPSSLESGLPKYPALLDPETDSA